MTSIWPKSCTSCSVTATNHWSWPCFIKYRSTFTPCTHHVTPWFTVSSFPPPLQEKQSTDWSIEQFSKEPENVFHFSVTITLLSHLETTLGRTIEIFSWRQRYHHYHPLLVMTLHGASLKSDTADLSQQSDWSTHDTWYQCCAPIGYSGHRRLLLLSLFVTWKILHFLFDHPQ